MVGLRRLFSWLVLISAFLSISQADLNERRDRFLSEIRRTRSYIRADSKANHKIPWITTAEDFYQLPTPQHTSVGEISLEKYPGDTTRRVAYETISKFRVNLARIPGSKNWRQKRYMTITKKNDASFRTAFREAAERNARGNSKKSFFNKIKKDKTNSMREQRWLKPIGADKNHGRFSSTRRFVLTRIERSDNLIRSFRRQLVAPSRELRQLKIIGERKNRDASLSSRRKSIYTSRENIPSQEKFKKSNEKVNPNSLSMSRSIRTSTNLRHDESRRLQPRISNPMLLQSKRNVFRIASSGKRNSGRNVYDIRNQRILSDSREATIRNRRESGYGISFKASIESSRASRTQRNVETATPNARNGRKRVGHRLSSRIGKGRFNRFDDHSRKIDILHEDVSKAETDNLDHARDNSVNLRLVRSSNLSRLRSMSGFNRFSRQELYRRESFDRTDARLEDNEIRSVRSNERVFYVQFRRKHNRHVPTQTRRSENKKRIDLESNFERRQDIFQSRNRRMSDAIRRQDRNTFFIRNAKLNLKNRVSKFYNPNLKGDWVETENMEASPKKTLGQNSRQLQFSRRHRIVYRKFFPSYNIPEIKENEKSKQSLKENIRSQKDGNLSLWINSLFLKTPSERTNSRKAFERSRIRIYSKFESEGEVKRKSNTRNSNRRINIYSGRMTFDNDLAPMMNLGKRLNVMNRRNTERSDSYNNNRQRRSVGGLFNTRENVLVRNRMKRSTFAPQRNDATAKSDRNDVRRKMNSKDLFITSKNDDMFIGDKSKRDYQAEAIAPRIQQERNRIASKRNRNVGYSKNSQRRFSTKLNVVSRSNSRIMIASRRVYNPLKSTMKFYDIRSENEENKNNRNQRHRVSVGRKIFHGIGSKKSNFIRSYDPIVNHMVAERSMNPFRNHRALNVQNSRRDYALQKLSANRNRNRQDILVNRRLYVKGNNIQNIRTSSSRRNYSHGSRGISRNPSSLNQRNAESISIRRENLAKERWSNRIRDSVCSDNEKKKLKKSSTDNTLMLRYNARTQRYQGYRKTSEGPRSHHHIVGNNRRLDWSLQRNSQLRSQNKVFSSWGRVDKYASQRNSIDITKRTINKPIQSPGNRREVFSVRTRIVKKTDPISLKSVISKEIRADQRLSKDFNIRINKKTVYNFALIKVSFVTDVTKHASKSCSTVSSHKLTDRSPTCTSGEMMVKETAIRKEEREDGASDIWNSLKYLLNMKSNLTAFVLNSLLALAIFSRVSTEEKSKGISFRIGQLSLPQTA